MKKIYSRTRRLKETVIFFIEYFKPRCFFCNKEITSEDVHHITKHHINGNHDDNRVSNWAFCHEDCHRRYNAKTILHKKNSASAKKECKKKIK